MLPHSIQTPHSSLFSLFQTSLFLCLLTLASCVDEKASDKGIVDTSSPPESPLALDKADDASNLLPLEIESTHPYANNLNEEFVIDLSEVVPSCTAEVRLHFAALQLEEGYDSLAVVNGSGQVVESYTGNHSDLYSPWMSLEAGNIVSVVLESDFSIVRHGFRIDGVEWASNLICPAFVPNLCAADEINISQPRNICGCQQQSICIPKAEFHARRSFGGGVTGGFSGKRLEGKQAWSFSNLSRTDFPLGTIDDEALTDFMSAVVRSGMLHGESVSLPGNISDEFSLSAGGNFASYAREPGSFPQAQAEIMEHFSSLFVCGVGQPLSCDDDLECNNGSCVDRETCVCPEIYAPVCSTGGRTFSSQCDADCVGANILHEGECGIVGDTCGGFQGLECQPGLRCRFGPGQFDFPFPDAAGLCVGNNYCDVISDCGQLIRPAVPGTWSCEQNQCNWLQGSPWTEISDWSMESTHPYSNDSSEWKQLFAPEGASSVRIDIDGTFSLESDYDFLEVWTWNGSAWSQVARFTGTESPGASYEFDGRYHYLHFVSDVSVVDHGFSLRASYQR